MNPELMSNKELARLLAEQGMGWTLRTKFDNGAPCIPRWERDDGSFVMFAGFWRPLVNETHAIQVIKGMCALGWESSTDCDNYDVPWSQSYFKGRENVYAEAETFQRAVCIAAAKAITEST